MDQLCESFTDLSMKSVGFSEYVNYILVNKKITRDSVVEAYNKFEQLTKPTCRDMLHLNCFMIEIRKSAII